MIKGFDNETAPLNEYEERTLLPIIANWLKQTNKLRPIINKKATMYLNNKGYKINEARFRKIVNAIRMRDIVPNVVATSKGYYVSSDAEEVAAYIQSLRDRAGAINAMADALVRQGSKIELTLF